MGKPVVYFDIGCRDKKKTAAFYTKLFGWSREEDDEHHVGVKTGAGTGIDGGITALGHEPHNYTMIYIQVEDIPATLESIEAAGGKTVLPETSVGTAGNFAWFQDPEGNKIGLWKPKA